MNKKKRTDILQARNNNWRFACVAASASVGEGIRVLNKTGLRLVLVVGQGGSLLGTVSDGDIRRGLLRGLTLRDGISKVMHRHPLVVSPSIDPAAALEIMRVNRIFQIPVVDRKKILRGLHSWDEIGKQAVRKNPFVIMAGGRGSRMMPYTQACPKPMLPVDGKPMLEHILIRAREDGFRCFFLCIHYLGSQVERYFRDGKKWGVEIRYVREKKPLGTAGALGLLPKGIDVPVVVSNGDVITDVKYGDLLDFHVKHQGFATMAVQLHRWEHPFGVVEMNGIEVLRIQEKPISQHHVNAGIYILSSDAIKSIDKKKSIHMTDFFSKSKRKRKKILAYPLHEPWLDVGSPKDLLFAKKQLTKKY